ncbi:MAG: YcxB family protein [Bacteroidota bacterium]
MERVAANDTHIFIYVSANSAHVIPRAAFTSAQQAEEFLQTARRYEQAANGPAGQA